MFAPASPEPYNFRSMTPVAGRCVEDGGSDTRSPNLELSTALRIHKARVLEGGGGGHQYNSHRVASRTAQQAPG